MRSCPQPDQLRRLLDACLPADENATLANHVDTCERCQKTLDELTAANESWPELAPQISQPSQAEPALLQAMERLGSDRPHSLSFQSKVGPVKWLRPSTDETIRKLADEGVSQLLLVPVSFVSDHIETLYELDILYRHVAEEVGIAHYGRVPALNCRPDFIEALAGLVAKCL